MARPTQTWCTLIQRRTRPTQRIQFVAVRRGLLIGGADEPSSRSLRELVPAIAAVEKCQPRRSGQRGNRLARKSSQCRTPHQQGELGRQPIRRCVGRPAHSIQLRERLAPVSIGAIAMHEPPDRQHSQHRDQHDCDAQRPGLRPKAHFLRERNIDQARERIALFGLRVSQCSLPRDHGRRRAPCGSARCRASGEAVGPCLRRR